MDKKLLNAAEALGDALKARKLRLATAESCTAGLISTALGAASASSEFFTAGLVTYTGAAKHRILKVSKETLEIHSAVSEQSVREMATGAQQLAGVDVSLAISGYAGPDGGEDGTPAGTIWFAWCLPEQRLISSMKLFQGEPESVIHAAALFAMNRLTALLTGKD